MKRSLIVTSIAALGLSFGALSAIADVPDASTIAAAKTPADHEAIAKAYESEADSLEKMAAKHKDLGSTYGQPGGKPWQAGQAKHCNSVASDLEKAAKEERALAAEHHNLAKSAGH
jgi:hypothetical protein